MLAPLSSSRGPSQTFFRPSSRVRFAQNLHPLLLVGVQYVHGFCQAVRTVPAAECFPTMLIAASGEVLEACRQFGKQAESKITISPIRHEM